MIIFLLLLVSAQKQVEEREILKQKQENLQKQFEEEQLKRQQEIHELRGKLSL